MPRLYSIASAVVVILVFVASTAAPSSGGPDTATARPWVTGWAAAPQGAAVLGGTGVESLSGYPLPAGLSAPISSFENQTIRQVMHLRHGGDAIRVELTNEFGTSDLVVDSVVAGRSGGDGNVVPGSQRQVTFGGSSRALVPPGRTLLSDRVDLTVDSFDNVVISMFTPEATGPATVHANANQSFFVAGGDRTRDASATGFVRHGLTEPHLASFTTAWYYVRSIQSSPRAHEPSWRSVTPSRTGSSRRATRTSATRTSSLDACRRIHAPRIFRWSRRRSAQAA
jgi:hypothetical protein